MYSRGKDIQAERKAVHAAGPTRTDHAAVVPTVLAVRRQMKFTIGRAANSESSPNHASMKSVAAARSWFVQANKLGGAAW